MIHACVCNSTSVELYNTLKMVEGQMVGAARIACKRCGFTLNYPLKLPKNLSKDPITAIKDLNMA